MLLLDRPSSNLRFQRIGPAHVLKTALLRFLSRRRERSLNSLPRLSNGWLSEYDLESAKRRTE